MFLHGPSIHNMGYFFNLFFGIIGGVAFGISRFPERHLEKESIKQLARIKVFVKKMFVAKKDYTKKAYYYKTLDLIKELEEYINGDE